MNLTAFSMKNPYTVAALALVVTALGAFAFFRTPTDLFPNTVPPQVAVVTVYPGAAAKDIADQVTQLLEKEINSAPGITRVLSTSRDEVSSIRAQFAYDKGIGDAVTDVQNAVARVRSHLPAGVREPLLYRITDATRPLLTIALTPKPASLKGLADIRLLAENDIKDTLLTVPGVGDVQIFGAHRPEVEVRIDRHALSARHLVLGQVLARLAARNVSAPAGTIYGRQGEYLVKVAGEFHNLQELTDLPIVATATGQVRLGDLATVRLGEADPRSFYHGNGKPAIAINILRPDGGHTVSAIRAIKKLLPDLARRYPDIGFAVTEDQQPLIDVNITGMRASIWQAVALTVLVIFFFLADLRAALAVSVAIPLSFLAALTVLWFSPFTMNMVTLSGLIIAVGMVVDASVVVIENIYRHYQLGRGESPRQAAAMGTAEVALPIAAGMLTTVVVLLPVMFTQGFTGRIMTPLNLMIIATLVASLVVSLTVIPLVAARLLGRGNTRPNLLERGVAPFGKGIDWLTDSYVGLVRWALRHRLLFMVALLLFLAVTNRVVKPLIGGEEMPPMDTGIITVDFDTEAGAAPATVEAILTRVEQVIAATPGLLSTSAMAGSEPGAVSFGSGGATTQSVHINAHLVDRGQRDTTIWQIEDDWRQKIRAIDGVRTLRITEYGATPVSTTKAPFDVILAGPDPAILDQLGNQVLSRLKGLPGLMDLRRSWYRDKPSYQIDVDPQLARLYQTSPAEVAAALRTGVQGAVPTRMRLDHALDIPIRVRYQAEQVREPEQLAQLPVPTTLGLVPLATLATLTPKHEAPFVSREELRNTLDITAGNRGVTIAQLTATAQTRLEGLQLPNGYTLTVAGSAVDMANGQRAMGKALLMGLVLLFILLFAMFKSVFHPLTIMAAIPPAVAGAIWGLLLFDKPFCKPAFMGIILLGGTIVNNAILMLDFILTARQEGLSTEEAIVQSVRLRLRPILMTAVSTIVGFAPLIFEMAVGLERMSPLGIAAGTGLLVGTMVTTVVTPVIYSLFESLRARLAPAGQGPELAASTKALLVALAAFGLLAAGPARAADAPLPTPLTLTAAVRYALAHNPDLEATSAEWHRLAGAAQTSRARLQPQLAFSTTATLSAEDHSVIPQAASTVQRFDNRIFSAGVQGRYLLFDFGNSRAEVAAALARTAGGQALLQRRQRETIFAVSQIFLSVLSVRDLRAAAEASRQSLAALLAVSEKLVAAGRAAPMDALKLKVQLARVTSELARLNGEQRSLRAELTATLGLADNESLPELADEPARSAATNADATDEAVIDRRADVIAARHQLDAAAAALKANRRARYPKVEALASYGRYAAMDPDPAMPPGPADTWADDAQVGIALTLPVFDGGSRAGAIGQAEARQQSAAAALRKARLLARRQMETARAALASARAEILATDQAQAAAAEALRIEKLKYESGKGTVNEVIDAEAARLATEGLVRRARRQTQIAALALALARGEMTTGPGT